MLLMHRAPAVEEPTYDRHAVRHWTIVGVPEPAVLVAAHDGSACLVPAPVPVVDVLVAVAVVVVVVELLCAVAGTPSSTTVDIAGPCQHSQWFQRSEGVYDCDRESYHRQGIP